MIYPWEKPEFDYIRFMDHHIRVSVSIDGDLKGMFAVSDKGYNNIKDVETVMPDGRSLTLKVEGHPRTMDPIMTADELVSYILERYKL